MSSSRQGRRLALALGLLAVMSLLFSASALAAGKPKGLILEATKGVNNLTLKATANPNGAATNVTFEKWNSAKLIWESISTVEIGSGTTAVTKEQFVGGLSSQTEYFFRFSASNTFGTSISGEETFYSYWSIEGFAETHEATINSAGKFRMEYTTFLGEAYKLECNQTGSGTINIPGGTKDHVSMEATGCVEYVNGKSTCSQPNLWFTTEAGWKGPLIWYKPFPFCSNSQEYALVYTEPFRVTSSGYGTSVPVTMTAKAQYGNTKNVTVTIESTWSVAGRYFGLITE